MVFAMRLRRDARFLLLYVASSFLWALALWFARQRPVDSSLYQQGRVGLSAVEVSNLVDRLLYQQGRVGLPVNECASVDARASGARVAERARFLGSGRSGSRVYWDVRDCLGTVRRYYARTNAVEISSVLRTIARDIRDSEAAIMAGCSAVLDE